MKTSSSSRWFASIAPTNRRTVYLLLLILPVCALWAASYMRDIVWPFYLMSHDPDYAYLFNGVSIDALVAPEHIDHPGTPLQMHIALQLKLMHPLSSAADIMLAVVRAPEKYLAIANYLLVFLIAVAAYIAGIAVYRSTKDVVPALLTQTSPLIYGVTLQALPRVNPEPLLLALGLLFVAYFARLAWGKNAPSDRRYPRSLGLLGGLGVAIKVTFAPVLLAPLVVFGGWWLRGRYLFFIALGFFIGTLPLLMKFPLFSLYERLFKWLTALVLGAGIYGQGPRTVIDVNTFVGGLRDIVVNQIPYVVVVVAAGVAFVIALWRRRTRRAHVLLPSERMLGGLVLMHVVMILLAAKHHQSDRYLIATMALSGFTLALVYDNVKRWFPRQLPWRWAPVGVGVLVVALAWPARASLGELARAHNERRAWLAGVEKVVRDDYPGCAQIHQDSSSPEFALFFGLEWSRKSTETRAARDAFFRDKALFTYDPIRNMFIMMSDYIVERDAIMRHYPCVIMRTSTGVEPW